LDFWASGATFAATSWAVALEADSLWEKKQAVEVYTAILRGRLRLGDIMRLHRRICRPSEGSIAWRLAGSFSEGREATTLVHGIRWGDLGGEPCTLAELRPVTCCPQQLRLHCVALGHPIVGDELHDADRRLDWRFPGQLAAPRLMLHCWHLRVPLARVRPLASWQTY